VSEIDAGVRDALVRLERWIVERGGLGQVMTHLDTVREAICTHNLREQHENARLADMVRGAGMMGVTSRVTVGESRVIIVQEGVAEADVAQRLKIEAAPLYARSAALEQENADRQAQIAALEQHISDLEKSLENARKERDTIQEESRARMANLTRAWASEEQAKKERDAAVADNAALPEFCAREAFRAVQHAEWGHNLPKGMTLEQYVPHAVSEAVAQRPRPGAALLAEAEDLREEALHYEADHRALYGALGWSWASAEHSLPAPSRAVVALLERMKRLDGGLEALRSIRLHARSLTDSRSQDEIRAGRHVLQLLAEHGVVDLLDGH
jgi:hypothetical protein